MIYVGMYVGLSTKKYVCHNAWAELRGPNTCMLKISLGQLKPILCHPYYSFLLYARAALAWTKKNVQLENNDKVKQTELDRLKNRGKKG